jgi:hypothetical protein
VFWLAQVGKGEWSAIPQGPPWAVDAWGLGCLLQETFSGQRLLRAEDLRQTASIPPGILQVPLYGGACHEQLLLLMIPCYILALRNAPADSEDFHLAVPVRLRRR